VRTNGQSCIGCCVGKGVVKKVGFKNAVKSRLVSNSIFQLPACAVHGSRNHVVVVVVDNIAEYRLTGYTATFQGCPLRDRHQRPLTAHPKATTVADTMNSHSQMPVGKLPKISCLSWFDMNLTYPLSREITGQSDRDVQEEVIYIRHDYLKLVHCRRSMIY
jgi:hypothetical protein